MKKEFKRYVVCSRDNKKSIQVTNNIHTGGEKKYKNKL